jgi:hypothetical protein
MSENVLHHTTIRLTGESMEWLESQEHLTGNPAGEQATTSSTADMAVRSTQEASGVRWTRVPPPVTGGGDRRMADWLACTSGSAGVPSSSSTRVLLLESEESRVLLVRLKTGKSRTDDTPTPGQLPNYTKVLQ